MGASAPIRRCARLNLSTSVAGLHFGTATLNQFHAQEHIMNKDQAKGLLEEAKGKVKEVAGNLVGNDDLELKGKIQKSGGKVQAAYGDLKEDLKDAAKGK
jgi:uncharacterized protein YjbJ (UPF0337 family)